MIYLDNSATTKPDKSVVESFNQVSLKYYANPSSIHEAGAEVEKLQTAARKQAAQLLNIDTEEVIFTSGGTEANNMAIKGIALNYQQRGKHIVTTEIEHASVFETIKALEPFGFETTILPVNEEGRVALADVQKALREDTILVSVMQVNNEIGTIQPIQAIGQLLKEYPKVNFHVDAVQGIGKVPLNLHQAGVDVCSFSGHKINGLRGTGILYLRKGVHLFPLLHGGGQEKGVRSGTENVAGNVSLVRALRLTKENEKNAQHTLKALNIHLREGLEKIAGVELNSPVDAAPHIMNVSVPGLKPETVIHALFEKGFAISSQSACSSKKAGKSRVLAACGKTDAQSMSGLRISLSYVTTIEEIEAFIEAFAKTIRELKQIFEVDKHGI